jgi:hypothetical protein
MDDDWEHEIILLGVVDGIEQAVCTAGPEPAHLKTVVALPDIRHF